MSFNLVRVALTSLSEISEADSDLDTDLDLDRDLDLDLDLERDRDLESDLELVPDLFLDPTSKMRKWSMFQKVILCKNLYFYKIFFLRKLAFQKVSDFVHTIKINSEITKTLKISPKKLLKIHNIAFYLWVCNFVVIKKICIFYLDNRKSYKKTLIT